jgi:hypothetical protein
MTPEHFAEILVRHGIIQADAIEYSGAYDGGATVKQISKAFPEIIKAVESRSNDLHRRLQRAESIIIQAKLVDNRPQGPDGRSLARALANYAAAKMKEDRDRWQSACEQRTTERNRLGVEIEGVKLQRDQWTQLCLEIIGQINSAEDRYPACPCGAIVFEACQRMPK